MMKMLSKPSRVHILFSLLVLSVVTACAVPNNSALPTPASETWDQNELRRVMEDWRVRSGVPGVVVGISLLGKPDILLASGKSDLEGDIPIREHDQFRIASITKTFIAAEVLKLAAEGKIQLDDPLNVYLPDTPHADVVTIRYLLSHRSGYFDPVHDDPGFIPSIAEHLEKQWTWEEMLTITFQHDLFFTPGSDYRYSNANYMLLGSVIEQVTQKSLGDVLASDLIVPLGLDQTLYATPNMESDPTRLVHGYATHPITGEIVDTTTIPYETILSASADTMISNAADLLKWSRALYGKESAVLAPAFQKEMLMFDAMSNYGLGVFQSDTPIGKSVGHGGDTAGYLSLMEYIPDQDLSLVILVNADASSINLSELRDSILVTMFDDSTESRVEKLVADLKSKNATTRRNAIITLGHSNTNSEQVISILVEILKSDPVAENRKEAALALGLVGRNFDQAKQALTSALQDADPTVREAAELALRVLQEFPG